MAIQIGGTSVVNNNRKGIFASANIGVFTPSTRPVSASTGDIIYNSSNTFVEVWDGTQWKRSGGAVEVVATGGNVTGVTSEGYKFHIFTSPGIFQITSPSSVKIDYLLAAGGGGGGGGANLSRARGGGGGAGGILLGKDTLSSGSYPITIGSGGSAGLTAPNTPETCGGSGFNSTFNGLTCVGGGYGGAADGPAPPTQIDGGNGGSGGGGGGAPSNPSGGTGTTGQGFPGGDGFDSVPSGLNGGGGGGALSAGAPGNATAPLENGQAGDAYTLYTRLLTGVPTSYGDTSTVTSPPSLTVFLPRDFATGGYGGGSPPVNPLIVAGKANTAQGGGAGTAGGSGICIISYRLYPYPN